MAVQRCRVKLVQVREDENAVIPKIGIVSFISNITTRDYKIASLVYASMLISNASGYTACLHKSLNKFIRVDTLI